MIARSRFGDVVDFSRPFLLIRITPESLPAEQTAPSEQGYGSLQVRQFATHQSCRLGMARALGRVGKTQHLAKGGCLRRSKS